MFVIQAVEYKNAQNVPLQRLSTPLMSDTKLHLMVRNTPSLSLLPGPLLHRLVVPFWVPSVVQIELFNHFLGIIIIIIFFENTAVYNLCILHKNTR